MTFLVDPGCVLQTPIAGSVAQTPEGLPDFVEQDFYRFAAQLAPTYDDSVTFKQHDLLSPSGVSARDNLQARSEEATSSEALGTTVRDSLSGRHNQAGGHPSWNPTPSVPDFYREELTCNLAEGLKSLPPVACQPADKDRHSNDGAGAIAVNEHASGAAHLQRVPPGKAPLDSSVNRKRAVNRLAQRTFRNKQKVELMTAPA